MRSPSRRVDEEVAEVRVAVHERARSRVPQRDDVVVAGEIDVGEAMELVGQPIADVVDGHLHELRAAAGRAGALRREPREIAVVVEAGRLPEPGVQRGHLLDDVAGPRTRCRRPSGCGKRQPLATRSSSTIT